MAEQKKGKKEKGPKTSDAEFEVEELASEDVEKVAGGTCSGCSGCGSYPTCEENPGV